MLNCSILRHKNPNTSARYLRALGSIPDVVTERIRCAMTEPSWLEQVVAHKSKFFAAKGRDGNAISYQECLQGNLRLVPDGEALQSLREDYEKMVQEGFMFNNDLGFDSVISKCQELETMVNLSQFRQ